ncbi:MAG TPA: LysE family transporter [Alphaproteobacteria bacterium]|nr:LysE family transporter [Alphaproteobacteria bacterium]
MDGLLGIVLAGVALTGSPGPANLSLAAAGAAFGARRSLGYLAGIVAGMIAVMGVAAIGGVGMILALPGASPVFAALSAAYFIHLAFRIATAAPLTEPAGGCRPPSFAGGVFLSLVNPKGYAAMAALFSGFVLIRGRLELDALAKLAVLAAILTMAAAAWLLAGTSLTRLLRDPRASRIVNVACAISLVASVAFALWL